MSTGVMYNKLPYNNFEWLEEPEKFNLNLINPKG